MRLTREQIAALIPHHGAMCLLDEVLSADPATLQCRAYSHRAPDHPMRAADGLGAACAIEYAAQAMALHDALRGDDAHRAARAARSPDGRYGILVSLRDVRVACRRLDTVPDPLIVQVELLSGDDSGALYAFQVGTSTRELVAGRASVILEATRRRARDAGASGRTH